MLTYMCASKQKRPKPSKHTRGNLSEHGNYAKHRVCRQPADPGIPTPKAAIIKLWPPAVCADDTEVGGRACTQHFLVHTPCFDGHAHVSARVFRRGVRSEVPVHQVLDIHRASLWNVPMKQRGTMPGAGCCRLKCFLYQDTTIFEHSFTSAVLWYPPF